MDAFAHFLKQYEGVLRQLVGATRGEYRHEDVCQQAWLEAREMADEQGVPPDFLDPAFQAQIIVHLRRRLVYADRRFRHATRLDHGFGGDDDVHPLARRLVSDEGRDPLSELLDAETPVEAPDEDDLPLSLALAWVLLLRQHEQRMRAVAARLLISVSHAYHCCAKARRLAACQHPIPLEPALRHTTLQLGPWRRQRAIRIPQQLAFDFDEALDFADSS
jgi:hypothetical protein